MKWILVILIPLLQGCNTWQLPENLGSDLLSSFDPRIPYRGQGSIYDPHVHDYNPDRYYQDQNDNHLIDLSPAWYNKPSLAQQILSLIHISEPTRRRGISYAVFCLKKKK